MTTRKSDYDRWFGHWFLKGVNGGRPGHEYYWRWGLLVDVLVGGSIMFLSPVAIGDAARVFLLPVAGIMIGLTFAWVGNANAVLQTPEIEGVARRMRGGLEAIIWEFQLAVLILLIVAVMWGLASVDVFDETWPTPARSYLYNTVEATLYAASSLALRACWRVVRDAQNLFVTRHRLREELRKRGAGEREDRHHRQLPDSSNAPTTADPALDPPDDEPQLS